MGIIIKSIGWQNIRSYGAQWTEIKLSEDTGSLSLLLGVNGSGKSTVSDSIDFCLFGKCKGKDRDGGSSKMSTIPNMFNGNMLTKASLSVYGKDIEISRGLAPNVFEIKAADVEIDKAGKNPKQSILDSMLRMDFSTFRNFVNISANEFKNFIELKAEDKRKLLDRMFGLEVLNELHQVSRDLARECSTEEKNADFALREAEAAEYKLSATIEEYRNRIRNKNDAALNELRASIEALKPEYATLTESLKTENQRLAELTEQITHISNKGRQHKALAEKAKEGLALYASGKCPSCARPFDEGHATHSEALKSEYDVNTTAVSELLAEHQLLKEQKTSLESDIKANSERIADIASDVRSMKQQISRLEEASAEPDLGEFESQLLAMSSRTGTLREKKNEKSRDSLLWGQLVKAMSPEGLKSSLVAKLVPQLNWHVRNYLTKLNSQYTVEFDSQFDAIVTKLGRSADPDNLSTGQGKLVNIAILLSCLSIMQMRAPVNMIFLDEIFASIDTHSIRNILKILKEFAEAHKINVFVVHHAQLELDLFDKIYMAKMDVFSTLTEITSDNASELDKLNPTETA